MPHWLKICHQDVDVINGVAHARPCPCSEIKSCPDCTYECVQGKKHCMTWVNGKGQERKAVYNERLYNYLTHKKNYNVFTTLPTPFKCCEICMYAVPHEFYSICETRPFKQVFEDLPF